MATVTKPIILDETGQSIVDAIDGLAKMPQIVDNLNTADATKVLSANMGKVLKDSFAYQILTPSDVVEGTTITLRGIFGFKRSNYVYLFVSVYIKSSTYSNTTLITIPEGWRASEATQCVQCFYTTTGGDTNAYPRYVSVDTSGQITESITSPMATGCYLSAVFMYPTS